MASYIVYGLLLLGCLCSTLADDSHDYHYEDKHVHDDLFKDFKFDDHQDDKDYFLDDHAQDHVHNDPYVPHHDHKKSVKCYQCAYSPAKTVEEQVKVPVHDAYGNIYYKTKYVKVEKPGGWDKCQ